MKNKHGAGAEEALRMLDSFASVGAREFDFTATDLDEAEQGFRHANSTAQARALLPSWIDVASKQQCNVIVRPYSKDPCLIQLDDLDSAALARVAPVAFLVLATSPGNHQAWVAVSPCVSDDFPRRLKKGTHADPTASGATRIAGHPNFKRAHGPDFPTVTILQSAPGRIVTANQLEALNLVAAPEPMWQAQTPPARAFNPRSPKKWPSYERFLEKAPCARGSDRPDVSRADFTWCMVAIDGGFTVEETAARLMEESSKARENGKPYALRTAANASLAVQRRQQQGR